MKPVLATNDSEFSRANSFPWPPVLFAAAVFGALALTRTVPLDWPGIDDWPARAVGLGFGIIGVMLIASAIIALRAASTTVMPHGTSSALVTAGPYGYFRNPIYLGEVLILLSLAEISKSLWFVAGAAAFAVLVTILQIIPEERHLEARFQDAYRAYKARSRRWI